MMLTDDDDDYDDYNDYDDWNGVENRTGQALQQLHHGAFLAILCYELLSLGNVSQRSHRHLQVHPGCTIEHD